MLSFPWTGLLCLLHSFDVFDCLQAAAADESGTVRPKALNCYFHTDVRNWFHDSVFAQSHPAIHAGFTGSILRVLRDSTFCTLVRETPTR